MIKTIYLVLAAALLLSACDGSDSNKNGAAPTAQPATPAIPIGKNAKADGLEFTVTKVRTPPYIEYGPKANKGEVFVIVNYMLKNTSGKPLPLLSRPAITLVDASGQSYNMDDFLTASSGVDIAGQASFLADINPGITVEGRAAWKLSAAAFDKATWKLALASDPQLTFSLK